MGWNPSYFFPFLQMKEVDFSFDGDFYFLNDAATTNDASQFKLNDAADVDDASTYELNGDS